MSCDNIVIGASPYTLRDLEIIYDKEPVHVTERSINDLPDLLVYCGVYASRSKARQAGRVGAEHGFCIGYSESKYLSNTKALFKKIRELTIKGM